MQPCLNASCSICESQPAFLRVGLQGSSAGVLTSVLGICFVPMVCSHVADVQFLQFACWGGGPVVLSFLLHKQKQQVAQGSAAYRLLSGCLAQCRSRFTCGGAQRACGLCWHCLLGDVSL
jgi:hypothetical protein